MFHKLTINGPELKLDDFKLKGVQSYELKADANNLSQITIKLYIDVGVYLLPQSAGNNTDSDLRKDIKHE